MYHRYWPLSKCMRKRLTIFPPVAPFHLPLFTFHFSLFFATVIALCLLTGGLHYLHFSEPRVPNQLFSASVKIFTFLLVWSILRSIYKQEVQMNTAKLFKNGKSQAVRLPKEFKFAGDEVYINRIGRNVILIPKDDPWGSLLNSLNKFSDDFMSERIQPSLKERKKL